MGERGGAGRSTRAAARAVCRGRSSSAAEKRGARSAHAEQAARMRGESQGGRVQEDGSEQRRGQRAEERTESRGEDREQRMERRERREDGREGKWGLLTELMRIGVRERR
eukprot:722310-Rhodomonas_salina.1